MSRYLCLCGKDVDPQTKLPRNRGTSNLHTPSDLYFCPRCHALKCVHCCTVAVECKYCPSCMADYSDHPGLTRCTKNCFQCPECRSPLDIEIHDLEVQSCKGKKFTFACVYCTYSYQTRFISKPASLTTILKNERPSYFSQLHAKYSLRHRLYAEQPDSELKNAPKNHYPKNSAHKDASSRSGKQKTSLETREPFSVTPEVVSKMHQLNVNPEHVMDERASLVYRMEQIATRPVDIEGDFRVSSEVRLPVGNHLYAKKSYTCSVCSTRLCMPVADPRSMKYLTKEVAPDVVPAVSVKRKSIRAKRGMKEGIPVYNAGLSRDSEDPEETPNGVSCTLSIINPLLNSINVTVSSGQVPAELASIVGSEPIASVALPVTSFTIGPRQEKAKVLDAVPSVYLTDATSVSRAEKLTRTIRNESNNGILEKGFNWVSVPLNVLLCRTEDIKTETSQGSSALKVGVYVTVETRAPDAWVASGKCKKSLKYGFWAVCEVEDCAGE